MKSIVIAAALTAALALPSEARAAAAGGKFLPAGAPTNEVRVAVRVLENNMPLVDCLVDGRPCTLLFDTGATHTTLGRAFVARELPDRKLEKVVLGGETNVEGAPSLFRVASLKVDAAEFSDFDMMALDLSHLPSGIGAKVDGVLGMNVIGRVPVMVSLGSREAFFLPARRRLGGFTNSVARVMSDPLSIALVATLGARRFGVIVDSGATFSFLGQDTGWPASEERAGISATDVNGSGSELAPRRGRPGELLLGIPLSLSPMIVPEPMNRVGADALLRYDMLVFRRGVAFRPHAASTNSD